MAGQVIAALAGDPGGGVWAGDRRAAAGEGRDEQREAIATAVGVTLVRWRRRVEAA